MGYTESRPLKMFTDDYEYFAAYDYEDLKCVIRAYRGSDYDPKDYGGDPIQDVFTLCDPSHTSKVWLDSEGRVADTSGKLTPKTNAEWLAQLGRGFLWSTEF